MITGGIIKAVTVRRPDGTVALDRKKLKYYQASEDALKQFTFFYQRGVKVRLK
jgi:hypothetical protein